MSVISPSQTGLLLIQKQAHLVHETILYSARLLPDMQIIPPPHAAPLDGISAKTRRHSENKWWPAQRQIWNAPFVGANEIIHTSQGELEDWAFSRGHCTDTLISCFSLSPICLYGVFTNATRGGGRGGGEGYLWMCVGVFTVWRSLGCDEWDS